jgi:peptidoglycan/LPS O-acetylase OafA/YrhL
LAVPKSGAAEKSYRPDIDGLRALAVLSVVLFHGGVPWFTGGFTGVDIFFVISGYLIGGHIFSELRSGNFSFLRFYQRRAKRILPACYVVILFTIAVSMFLLSPYEAAQLGRSALAATLSASNILFWKTTGYFDMRSELNPMLMTWSLGVEEQFYAIIPLLMVLLVRIRRDWLLPSILVFCVLSFGMAQYELGAHPPLVFYMLPPRAWELGVGVALAVAELGVEHFAVPPKVGQFVSAGGLLFILAPVFLLTVTTPFPGAAALPSVLGTAMLLAGPRNWINNRLLSLPPLTFVGRISYSLYLWHWPLLAFGRVVYGGKLSHAPAACLVALAFGAAVLSYYFVEQPFRKSTLAPAPLLIRYAIVSFGVLAVCAFVWLSHGVSRRYPQLAAMEDSGLSLSTDPCLAPYGKYKPNLSLECYDHSANRPAVALWGDSHSGAVAPGLRSAAAARGYGFVQLGKSSCPPLVGATRYAPNHPTLALECLRFNRQVLEILEADRTIQIVVLAGYWEVPFHKDFEDGWLTADLSSEHEVPALAASYRLFENSLTASIRALQAAGKQVIVLEDVPMFDADPLWRVRTAQIPVRRDLARWLGLEEGNDPGFASPRVSSTTSETSALLREAIAKVPNVELVDLKSAFCGTPGDCLYRDGDRLLYSDTQHLSAVGAQYALRDFQLPAPASVKD